jgi:GNAT superfamily N-acetyltransferase
MIDERIRRARPEDIPALVELVYALAEYERAPDECHLTASQLETALFGPDPAVFCHVAEHEGEIAGCAIWFLHFSTWRGVHGIYLEDLFVRPETRGTAWAKPSSPHWPRNASTTTTNASNGPSSTGTPPPSTSTSP